MKLILKNFRCYENKEIDFGEKGLVLISGQSGTGKSTIMMAIMFVLYDIGTKLISFGKTTTEVSLEIDGYYIKRKKRPNYLELIKNEEKYENESAQTIINQIFGKAFETSSYIKQNAINSFVVMSPVEKLEFLEKFAIDIGNIKIKTQQEIKKRNEELIIVQSQYEMAKQYLEKIKKPEKVICKFKTDRTIKNQEIKLKNTKVLIKKKQKEIEKINEEINETKLLDNEITIKKELITNLNKKIENLSSQEKIFVDEKEIIKLENELKQHLRYKNIARLKTKITDDEKKLETIKKHEKEEIQKKINKIDLWKDYKKHEIETLIEEQKNILQDLVKLENIQKKLNKYKNFDKNEINKIKDQRKFFIEENQLNQNLLNIILMNKEIYSCPSCSVKLKLSENKLQIYDEPECTTYITTMDNEINIQKKIKSNIEKIKEFDNEVKDLEKFLTLFEELEIEKNNIILNFVHLSELPEKKTVENKINYYNNYMRINIDNEKLLEKLKLNLINEKYSNSYFSFYCELEKLKKELNNELIKIGNDYNFNTNFDEELIREKIYFLKDNHKKNLQIEKEISQLNDDIKNTQLSIDKIKENFDKKFIYRGQIFLESFLFNSKKELKILFDQLEELEKNMVDIQNYKNHLNESKIFNDWSKKVDQLKIDENIKKNKYAAATLFKEKIIQAESLSIINIINSINIHTQEYLELFFPDNPIIVTLCTFKENKKKNISLKDSSLRSSKPQINMEIIYKGMEADISMLSGGELARVVLAFTLSLSEIFNSPLLLLDECTSSLDQETTSIVMEGIKKNFSEKLVISIAHQVISGDFDRQIEL